MSFYPEVPGPIRTLLLLVKEQGEDYLDGSPYDDDLKALLRPPQLDGGPIGEVIVPEDIDIEQEARRLYVELRAWGKTLNKDDTTEMATVFRNSTSLLEKLLKIASDAADVKAIGVWKEMILQFMEDVLTEDQRIEFEALLARQVAK